MRLAVMGGLDPWGHVFMRDLIVAADARRVMIDAQNMQLIALLGNSMSDKPKDFKTLQLGGR